MKNRLNSKKEILFETYRLLLTNNWESVTIEQIEKAIGKTRGAIFYFYKSKSELFESVIDYSFFSIVKFSVSEKDKIWLSGCGTLLRNYKSPFERVRDNLVNEYKISNPSIALFNVLLQAEKLYPSFSEILKGYIIDEMNFMVGVVRNCAVKESDITFYRLFLLKLGVLTMEAFGSNICSSKDVFDERFDLFDYSNRASETSF